MRLVFDQSAWSDYTYWVAEDRAILKRINRLLAATRPFRSLAYRMTR